VVGETQVFLFFFLKRTTKNPVLFKKKNYKKPTGWGGRETWVSLHYKVIIIA
jgi:hypothetical protein